MGDEVPQFELSENDVLALLVEHEPALRAYARSLVPDWDLVDEALQEASVTMWKKRGQLESADGFVPFLERVSERMWKCEGLFAEAKQYHRLARAKYRGRAKVQIQAYLSAMARNLKRLVLLFYLWLLTRRGYTPFNKHQSKSSAKTD